ncbi:MAG: patatin-like phospholipase family protein [Verrucomicrobiota bacterium]|nr:patatin-like phospholipase family protein [Verrucomicrobiota bacterium]
MSGLLETGFDEYRKGTVLFHEGVPCDSTYLIITGRCESRVRMDNSAVVLNEVFGPGDMLGARALLNCEPHRRTVVIATDAILLRIPREELDPLLASDPEIAGRFFQAVTRRVHPQDRSPFPRTGRVRRIVSFLPLASGVDALGVLRKLAAAMRGLTNQRVLLVHMVSSTEKAALEDWPAIRRRGDGEFCFRGELSHQPGGFDQLRISVGTSPHHATAVAPFLSHCGRHYDYVLLDVNSDGTGAAALECLIQSDVSYVFLHPSPQNRYEFKLLMQQLRGESRGACAHVKPIFFVEESADALEFRAFVKEFDPPVHSFVRGFPRFERSGADQRFELFINRLARELARCRIGLALSSGGAKGLAHIGVIQVLEENGIEVDCISGASIGAYVGALWACGLSGPELEQLAREHERRWGLFALLDPVVPPREGFLRTRRVIHRFRRSVGDAHFSDLVRPLRVIATTLDTLERVVFSSGEIASAVEASIAIPGVVVPVLIGADTYIDGGIADPLPVDVLDELGMEQIIAVNVIPPPEQIRQWKDIAREKNGREPARPRMGRLFSTHLNYFAQGNILDTMMQAISGSQTRVAETAALKADVVVRPLACDALWHDFTHPAKYVALGRKAAEEQLPHLKALTKGAFHENPSQPLVLSSPVVAA